jgi:cellulose synthase/poly-beta-1,6-N-acetylglucosamine synthase-like glycosyltransferase
MIEGGRKLLNPLVAAQNFEYKMSNILGKLTPAPDRTVFFTLHPQINHLKVALATSLCCPALSPPTAFVQFLGGR